MSQYQPPFQPDYASYGMVPPNPRPTSVTALSITAIIVGSLGLLCGAFGALAQVMTLAMGGKNPMAPNLPAATSQGVNAYGAFASVVLLGLAGALLAGGIGGLKLRPWARRLMIQLAVVTLVWATFQLIMQVAWVIPETASRVAQIQAQMDPQSAKLISGMMGPFQYGVAFISWIIWCILPTFFLTLWRSPTVIQAFDSGSVSAGGMPPLIPPGQQYPPT